METDHQFRGSPPLTPFIGRSAELAEIARQLEAPLCRLLTLVGPGGIGKTRLAIEAARQTSAFDAVHLVFLQPLTSSDLMVPTIAEAIDLQISPHRDPKAQLLDFLREKSVLLVLDNLEQLLDGVDLVSDILLGASAVKILATSRERLNLVEEWVLTVEGLPVPASEAAVEVDEFAAIQLFLQSAQRAQVGFKPTPGQQQAIIRICRLVGGMPLGIELAAGWVRTLSCDEIALEIEQSLELLATSARNVPPRHRTMRAVLDHSWQLLTEVERDVFPRLSVFTGGFRKEAAKEIAGATLQTLAALVNKSLLRVNGQGRYDLHELVRQYAQDRLVQADEVASVCDRHQAYYLAFAERAGQELFGANELDWFDWVEMELSNLRAAIAWSLEREDFTGALRLTGSLYRFWAERNYHQEGFTYLTSILSIPHTNERTMPRALALHGAGYIRWFEGDNVAAHQLLEEAIAIAREVGDPQQLATTIRTLGPVLYGLGEYAAAGELLEESLLLARKLPDGHGIGWSLMFLGDVMLQSGNVEQAQRFYEESIVQLRELRNAAFLAYAIRRLGVLMAGLGKFERGWLLCRESLELNLATDQRRAVAASLIALGGIALMQGDERQGATLLSAAERVLNENAAHLLRTDQVEYERHLETARMRLGASFEQAWEEGQSMTLEQAVANALKKSLAPKESEPAKGVEKPEGLSAERDSLTVRELQILELLAQGMTNAAIAANLFLAVGTVKWYVSQICSKLHAQGRVQAIARARELHILP